METINVVNPQPKDFLANVRVSAETIAPVVLLDLPMRDQFNDLLDEVLAFFITIPKDAPEAKDECRGLIAKLIGKLEDFAKVHKVVHCDRCKSSFSGSGLTEAMALADADAGWLVHTDAHHPECKACEHQVSDHTLGVCEVYGCTCRVKASQS
jgi:hypothetical protein